MPAGQCSHCGATTQASSNGSATCKYCGHPLTVAHSDLALELGRTAASRSNDTRVPVPVTFVNRRAPVALFWLDFAGAAQPYGRLETGASKHFQTYVGHIWSVRDAESGDEVLRWAAPDQVPREVSVGA